MADHDHDSTRSPIRATRWLAIWALVACAGLFGLAANPVSVDAATDSDPASLCWAAPERAVRHGRVRRIERLVRRCRRPSQPRSRTIDLPAAGIPDERDVPAARPDATRAPPRT